MLLQQWQALPGEKLILETCALKISVWITIVTLMILVTLSSSQNQTPSSLVGGIMLMGLRNTRKLTGSCESCTEKQQEEFMVEDHSLGSIKRDRAGQPAGRRNLHSALDSCKGIISQLSTTMFICPVWYFPGVSFFFFLSKDKWCPPKMIAHHH